MILLLVYLWGEWFFFKEEEVQKIFNCNIHLVISQIKISVAYYIYSLIRIFQFIEEIFKICFILFKLTD